MKALSSQELTRSQIKEMLKQYPADILAEVLAEQLGADPQAQPSRQWYDTKTAYNYLGLNSAEQLRELRRQGFFRPKFEYRVIGSTYQFHIKNCEARLNELPEKRIFATSIPRVARGRKPNT